VSMSGTRTAVGFSFTLAHSPYPRLSANIRATGASRRSRRVERLISQIPGIILSSALTANSVAVKGNRFLPAVHWESQAEMLMQRLPKLHSMKQKTASSAMAQCLQCCATRVKRPAPSTPVCPAPLAWWPHLTRTEAAKVCENGTAV
jgi:hypothetical protein